MIRVDQAQGSDLWLKWRLGGIGGSDAPVIMGVSPYQTRDELLAYKVRNRFGQVRKSNKNKTSAMMRGTLKEPEVRQAYMDLTGNFVEVTCGIHEEHDWMRASFDGLSLDGLLALEIKCPKYADHVCALAGQVPTHYYPQVQHLLAVSGAKKLHYVSWSDNKAFPAHEQLSPPVVVKPVADYIDDLIAAEKAFWEEMMEMRREAEKK